MDLCLLSGCNLKSNIPKPKFAFLGKEEDSLSGFELPEPLQNDSSILLVESDNGLVCLSSLKTPFVVWNPKTEQFRYLAKPLSFDEGSSSVLGFGFVNTLDYKVLKISRSNDRNGDGEFRYLTQVFTRSENSWREVKECIPLGMYKFYNQSWTTTAGVVYWLARRYALGQKVSSCDSEVFSFDLHDEVIRKISLPSKFLEQNGYSRVFRMYPWKKSIAVLAFQTSSQHCSKYVWVIGRLEDGNWTRLFRINCPDYWCWGVPFGVWKDHILFAKKDTVAVEDNSLYAYDHESQQERKLCSLGEPS